MTIFGIDVSHYQAGLDMKRAASEGIEFALIKCSQGSTSRDAAYATHLANARAAGLVVAAYHMISGDPPAAQAANCAGAIDDPSIPLALDWEASGGSGNWANFLAVQAAMRAKGLHVALAYAPRWYWSQQGSPDMSGAGIPLWSSRYVTAKGAPGEVYKQVTSSQWVGYGGLSVGLVQFTDSASVAGMTVDCSAFPGDRDQLAALLAAPRPSAAPATGEDHAMAPAPLPVTYFPDGRFRIAAQVESNQIGSQLYSQMWISYTSLWGDSTVAVTALDGNGAIIDGGPDKPVAIKNNVHQSYAVPAKATMVTLEGKVATPGDTEVCAFLLAKPL